MTATMNFFESQDVARKKTGRLVVMFVLAVICMVVALHLIVGVALTAGDMKWGIWDQGQMIGSTPLFDPIVLGCVIFGVLLIVGGGSAVKIAQLAGGGHVIAESLGGRLIVPESSDATQRRVLNIVEEMAIASGTPVPPVYLLPEDGINAFAAGYSPEDAVIGVTRGCAALLNRDELQGVIAHEFSHILNGDMRLNIRLMGVVHGLLVLGIIGYYCLRVMAYSGGGRRRGSKEGGGAAPILIIAVGLMVVGFVGTFFGNMIKAAVSRQREFLADASAVQFTRSPEGIGGALMKIGGHSSGSSITHPKGPEASHMYFGQGISSGLASMFATHPPLEKRIKAILPQWDGRFPIVEPLKAARDAHLTKAQRRREEWQSQARPASPRDQIRDAMRGGHGSAVGPGAAIPAGLGIGAMAILDMIGRPTQEHVERARQLINEIPESIREAAHESYGARAVVFALLLDRRDLNCRAKQMEAIRVASSEPDLIRLVEELGPAVQALPDHLRLPLIDLSTQALASMSPAQYQTFRALMSTLIDADESIEPFEWALERILRRHLDPRFGKTEKDVVHFYGLQRLGRECQMVLSTLAHAGTGSDLDAAQRAFLLGAKHLHMSEQTILNMDTCNWAELDSAISQLSKVAPQLKKRIIEACAICVFADRDVTVDEAELLRAFADGLGCPIPPILAGKR